LKFSLIRLSDGVHVVAVTAVPYRIVPARMPPKNLEPGIGMCMSPAPPLSASLLVVMQGEAFADVVIDLGELTR
jgi:hypothetical protein